VFTENRQPLHAMWAVPCIANACYPKAVRTRMVSLALEGPRAGSSPELAAPGQVAVRRLESMEEASGNWVAHFNGPQSREGLGAGVLLVSPMGQIHKYVIQLTFPQQGCASSTTECEGLLAGLRITT
jgi:hypothetical protein